MGNTFHVGFCTWDFRVLSDAKNADLVRIVEMCIESSGLSPTGSLEVNINPDFKFPHCEVKWYQAIFSNSERRIIKCIDACRALLTIYGATDVQIYYRHITT